MNAIAQIEEQSGLTRLTFELSGGFSLSKDLVRQINAHADLLPVEIIEKPDGYRLTYDAGSLISLSKYLRQNRLAQSDVLKILTGVCRPIAQAKENRLYAENFSFCADHIFIDAHTRSLKLIYFPFEAGGQADQAFKALICEVVGELLTPAEGQGDCITRIVDCCRQPSFRICTLDALLCELDAGPPATGKQKPAKARVLAKLGFFSRRFQKRRDTAAPQPEWLTPPEPPKTTAPRSSNGTELLIPDDQITEPSYGPARLIEMTVRANGMSSRVEIAHFPCTIGRSPQEAEIVLKDQSVSRRHAIIDYAGGVFVIVDNNSSNGIVFNGATLAVGAMQPLKEGDRLRFGRIEIEIDRLVGG